MTISWSPRSRSRSRSRSPTRRSSSSRCPTSTARSTSRSSPSRGRSPRTTSRSSSARSVCSALERRVRGHVLAGVGLGVFAAASLVVRARHLVRAAHRRPDAARPRRRARAGGRDPRARRDPRERRARDQGVGARGHDRRRGRSRARRLPDAALQLAQHLLAPGAARRDRARRRVRPPGARGRAARRGPNGARAPASRTPGSSRSTARSSARCSSSVLLLVVVWGWSPIAGALVVTTLPVGTIVVRRLDPRPARTRRGRRRGRRARGRARRARLPPGVDRGLGRGRARARAASAWVCSAACSRRPRCRRTRRACAPRRSASRRATRASCSRSPSSRRCCRPASTTARASATRATTAEVLDSSVSLRTKVSLALDLRDLVADAPRGEVPDPTVPFDKRGADNDAKLRATRDGVVAAIRDTLTRGFRSSFLIAALFARRRRARGRVRSAARASVPRDSATRSCSRA